MTMNPINPARYEAEARYCARLVLKALAQRGLQPSVSFYLTERNNLVWLAAVLNLSQFDGRMEGYVSSETLHQLSTMLQGKLVFLSNSTGLRYLILLSPPPVLPETVTLPNEISPNSLPLGAGLAGPVALPVPRNMLICGEPGSGKSTFLECIQHTAFRHQWEVYFIEPDGHTFNPDRLDSLAARPVAQSPKEALALLEHLEGELARRQALFRAAAYQGLPPADLDAYNQAVAPALRRMLVLVDEANSYFDSKAFLEKLTDLARRGRKWGLTFGLAGHNWRAADVPRSLSAMFPVRVSFRVADDTTATIVLGSRRWGKLAQELRLPGRAIVLIDGQYRLIQAYRLSAEQAGSLVEQVTPIAPLTPIEQALVRYALERLEGRFIVNRLAQALAEQGVTHHQVQKIAEQFEQRGWLTQPQHATDARRITPQLASLAGVTRTGVQAVQGHTGPAPSVQAPVQVGCA